MWKALLGHGREYRRIWALGLASGILSVAPVPDLPTPARAPSTTAPTKYRRLGDPPNIGAWATLAKRLNRHLKMSCRCAWQLHGMQRSNTALRCNVPIRNCDATFQYGTAMQRSNTALDGSTSTHRGDGTSGAIGATSHTATHIILNIINDACSTGGDGTTHTNGRRKRHTQRSDITARTTKSDGTTHSTRCDSTARTTS
jgi:hypothetical protein